MPQKYAVLLFSHDQVEREWERGNPSGAHKASQSAKSWGMASIISGLVLTAGGVLVIVISTGVTVVTAE